MNQTRTSSTASTVPFLHTIYLICMIGFAVSIVLQVYFAGAALLVNPDYLNVHRAFGGFVTLMPLPLVGLAAWARLPRRMITLTVLFIPLVGLQYALLWTVIEVDLPRELRALHAANAIVMFVLAEQLIRMCWRLRPQPEITQKKDVL